MKTSIVIATYNKLEYTKQCIESIRQHTTFGKYEIIVVDNHSIDGSVEWLRGQDDIRLIENPENYGFPKACNQGIEVANGDSILLLNNDTVVTEKWLDNLEACLYSDPSIGAVSSVTNSCSYYQAIPVQYSSIEEMQRFAAEFNKSNPLQWEERLKLIGYCLLIKKSVIDEIGLLDERFTPGNYEDDDYSLRIRLQGYRLILCKDTFIHHFGSTSFRENTAYTKLMQTNRQKFLDKWGFDPDYDQEIVGDLATMIRRPSRASLRVLEVGCLNGGTLLRIKDLHPEAELFGVEPNDSARVSAALVANTVASFSGLMEQYPDIYFDVILVTRGIDKRNDRQLLEMLMNRLQPDGIILTRLSNALFFRHVHAYLQGKATDEQLASYRAHEMEPLFQDIGMKQVWINSLAGFILPEEESYLKQLAILSGHQMEMPYRIQSFYVRCSRMTREESVDYYLQRIMKNRQDINMIEELYFYEADEVGEALTANPSIAVEMCNIVGVQAYLDKRYDWAYRILIKAFEMNPEHDDTKYHLAKVLVGKEEFHLAYEWVQLVQSRNPQIEQFSNEIRHAIAKKKFLDFELRQMLRRIEFNVQPDGCSEKITEWLHEEPANMEALIHQISLHIISKAKVLNILAIANFEHGRHEAVIPFLQMAIEWEPEDPDTLYNLGYVLYTFGEHEMSRRMLNQIRTDDEILRGAVEELEEMLR